jgi:hypothetical protein
MSTICHSYYEFDAQLFYGKIEYGSLMQGYPRNLDRYMNVINPWMGDIANNSRNT